MDNRYGTPFRMRRQAYGAVLSGALVGYAYGHRDVWCFKKPWRQSMEDPGALQMGFVRQLFAARPWWKLEPDQGDGVVTQGRGTIRRDDYVSAGLAADGSLLVAYIPVARPITVDLSLIGNRFSPTRPRLSRETW